MTHRDLITLVLVAIVLFPLNQALASRGTAIVSVPSNVAWIDTGLTVEPGELITVTASGVIVFDSGGGALLRMVRVTPAAHATLLSPIPPYRLSRSLAT
jgi:hypothetical protein